ncbi:MAG TPA: DNA gyrase modulator, partial [Turneriella sp.]|nr:DNA gyrase modulator [Turneriella sp.]
MDANIAAKVIDAALQKGTSFVDLYEEETRNAVVSLKEKKIENATAGIEYGIGLRLLFGTEVVYGFTGNGNEESLMRLLHALFMARGKTTSSVEMPFKMSLPTITHAPRMQEVHILPSEKGQAAKLTYLQYADQLAYRFSPHIQQVAVSMADSTKKICIINSEGLFVEDERTRARFSVSVTAANTEGERFVASESPGALSGFEFFENLDIE